MTPSKHEDDSGNTRTEGRTNLSPVLLEYCKAQERSVELYGDNTLVMMQIGSFLEMYELRLADGSYIGNATAMGVSLNKMKETPLSTTGKDVKWYGGRRVDRIIKYGFNLIGDTKRTYINNAISLGYTVPVYYQVGNKDHSRGIEHRECLEVWSPLVRPDDSQSSSRWFVALLLPSYDSSTAELGFINPVTRKYTTHVVTRDGAVSTRSHDLFTTMSASEVVVWVNEVAGSGGGSCDGSRDEIRRTWGVPRECPVRVIPIRGNVLDVDDMIRSDLMRYIGDRTVSIGDGSVSASVARGIDYLRNIVPQAVEGVRLIEEHSHTQNLILENQPLRQLNILAGGQDVTHVRKQVSSVANLLDKTQTKMGRRIHVQRISTPTTSVDDIHARQSIGKWFVDNELQMDTWNTILSDMPDIGALFSARVYGGLSYALLWKCTVAIKTFVDGIRGTDIPISFPQEDCIRFYEKITNEIVSPDTLPEGGNAIGGVFSHEYGSVAAVRPDVPFQDSFPSSGIHEKHARLLVNLKRLEDLVRSLNNGGSTSKKGNMAKNALFRVAMIGNTYYILGTKSTGPRLARTRVYDGVAWDGAEMVKVDYIASRGDSYILSDNTRIRASRGRGSAEMVALRTVIQEASRLRREIDEEISVLWMDWALGIRKEFEELVREMADVVGAVDVARSSAVVVKSFGYTWPDVSGNGDGDGDSSWVVCDKLRHPLIERMRQDVSYVPHSFAVGNTGDSESPIGRLVFGVNSSGKSSLMKALGISVILAQTGLPVPAREMRLGIFRSLFTRILGNDDLFRGLSTFRVEADELVRILRNANQNSLVLGDELCSGTEQIGAESLVAASILGLLRRRCAFLFATHLHRIRDIPDLVHHPRLAWNHIRVDVDADGTMRMDRRLQEGAGPRGYAIDYVERMGGDGATMMEARRIRDMITSEEFSVMSARAWNESNRRGFADSDDIRTAWNSRAAIQSVCQVCKSRPSEETDHIIPRQLADSRGGIPGIGDVHNGGNLVGLCSVCHEKKTRGEIIVHGYQEYFDVESGGTRRVLRWEEACPCDQDTSEQGSVDTDTGDDFVNTTTIRMSRVGKTPRQIQGFLRRNGHRIRLLQITGILDR